METSPLPAFGALLRRHRRVAGLTQEALAERAGVSVRGLRDLERGAPHAPRRDTVELLAAALQLPAAEQAAFIAAARRLNTPSAPAALHLSGASTGAAGSAPPFVGRKRELALLERHLAGEGPPLLVLAGEPGIGKTRLLREARARALQQGWTVLEGGCQRRGGQEPYAPLAGALQRHIRGRRPGTLRTELQGCAWLVRLLPELTEAPIPPLPHWTLTPAQERRLMGEAVSRFLVNVTGPAGTLLLLDDLQWADPDALDLLASLLRSAGEAPLRFIVTYRDVEVQFQDPLATLLADLSPAGSAARHILGPLDAEAAARLLDTVLEGGDGDVDDARRLRVLRRAGGVPFFLLSCAQGLRLGGGNGADEDAVPWDVAQSVRQRVAALPGAARELLGVAAVVGRTAPRSLLTTLLARPQEETLAAFDAVGRARLLEEQGPAAYQFAHDLIREVIEADLGAARRAVLHCRVAEALEQSHGVQELPVEALAYHYARSDAQEKALLYLEAAGDRAQAQYAQSAAAGYYEEAVARLDQLGRRKDGARVREKLGLALTTTGRYEEALEALEQAVVTLRAAEDLEDLGRVTAGIGRALASRARAHDLTVGATRIYPLVELLEARGPSPALVLLYLALTDLYCMGGQLHERLAAAIRAVEVAHAVGDEGLLAEAEAQHADTLAMLGRDAEALPLLQEAGVRAEAVGSLDALCTALLYAAWVHEDRGEFDLGWQCATRARAAGERLGDPDEILNATIRLGALAFLKGTGTRHATILSASSLFPTAPPYLMPRY